MVNLMVVVFFYRLQPITTNLISKLHEKSLALTLFSKLCQCRGLPKLPKTSLTHVTERQTHAGGATITSYIMVSFIMKFPMSVNPYRQWHQRPRRQLTKYKPWQKSTKENLLQSSSLLNHDFGRDFILNALLYLPAAACFLWLKYVPYY